MTKFDIPVNFEVNAKDEASAEEVIKNFLKLAQQTFDVPDIVDWEFVEFIPNCLDDGSCGCS